MRVAPDIVGAIKYSNQARLQALPTQTVLRMPLCQLTPTPLRMLRTVSVVQNMHMHSLDSPVTLLVEWSKTAIWAAQTFCSEFLLRSTRAPMLKLAHVHRLLHRRGRYIDQSGAFADPLDANCTDSVAFTAVHALRCLPCSSSTRLKNIEETEKAKCQIAEQQKRQAETGRRQSTPCRLTMFVFLAQYNS